MLNTGPFSDLKSQGYRALLWNLSGRLGTQGIGFLFSIFLARLLDPSDFGLLAMVMVYVGIAGVFSDVGLASALIQCNDVKSIHYSSVFYFNLAVGLALTTFTLLLAPQIGEFYDSRDLVPVAELMSLAFVMNALGSVQAVRLRKELNYAALTKAGLCASLISSLAGLVLALYGNGVNSLVAQSLLMSGTYTILLWCFSGWAPSLKFSLAALTQLWGYGARMFMASLLDAVSTRLDILLIGKMYPVATLGYFDLARRLSNVVNQYSAESLMSVMFPVLSKIQRERERFNRVVLQTLSILSPIVFVVVGILFLSAEQVIVLLLSDKWIASAVYFKLLVLGGFAYPLNALLVNVLSSRGNSKAFLRMAIVKKTIFFSNFISFAMWGIEAYLMGLIFVGIVNTAITLIYAAKEMQIDYLSLARPIIIQSGIFAVSLIVAVMLSEKLPETLIINFAAKNALFMLLILIQNVLLQTSSWISIKGQLTFHRS